ncbi:MAG: wax ester/triacylglycerol synthase family O-acyltransferase [Candidatus Pelagadaptatus aseana]|uniref:WS/DGAT/MGAT family O-acyltransferase n=1 Tax=Candidatus Pelagadaptatus aseana TaxID=3120508 RepID=UPI0039B17BFE
MSRMPLTDAFFLTTESRRQPMHVGGLNLFKLPDDIDEIEFLQSLSRILKEDTEMRHPFGKRLKMGPLGQFGPIQWNEDKLLDMDYHIRQSALPQPGRYLELFKLVSRLHTTLLDRSRPLWELHLIEGLQNREFAIYSKFHHCAIDGMGAMHLLNSMFSPDPTHKIEYSPFSATAYEAYKKQRKQRRKINPTEEEIKTVSEVLKDQFQSSRNIASALRRFAGAWVGRAGDLEVPWHKVPKTNINTKITGARRFVAQSWNLERIKTLGKAFDGTLNDAVLAICSGALRKHLEAHNDLPSDPLMAMTPVSLRAEGDVDSANAISFMTANLATHIKDPAKRVEAIQSSMKAAKANFQGMSRREIEAYTIFTQAPIMMMQMLKLQSKFPPYSTVISNVPGPREQMYWNGAALKGIYPASIPFDGMSLNITLVSNSSNLDFGITACRHSVPQVQRLIDYIDESIVELEDAAGIAKPVKKAPRKSPARKAAPKKAAAAKASTKKAEPLKN